MLLSPRSRRRRREPRLARRLSARPPLSPAGTRARTRRTPTSAAASRPAATPRTGSAAAYAARYRALESRVLGRFERWRAKSPSPRTCPRGAARSSIAPTCRVGRRRGTIGPTRATGTTPRWRWRPRAPRGGRAVTRPATGRESRIGWRRGSGAARGRPRDLASMRRSHRPTPSSRMTRTCPRGSRRRPRRAHPARARAACESSSNRVVIRYLRLAVGFRPVTPRVRSIGASRCPSGTTGDTLASSVATRTSPTRAFGCGLGPTHTSDFSSRGVMRVVTSKFSFQTASAAPPTPCSAPHRTPPDPP